MPHCRVRVLPQCAPIFLQAPPVSDQTPVNTESLVRKLSHMAPVPLSSLTHSAYLHCHRLTCKEQEGKSSWVTIQQWVFYVLCLSLNGQTWECQDGLLCRIRQGTFSWTEWGPGCKFSCYICSLELAWKGDYAHLELIAMVDTVAMRTLKKI